MPTTGVNRSPLRRPISAIGKAFYKNLEEQQGAFEDGPHSPTLLTARSFGGFSRSSSPPSRAAMQAEAEREASATQKVNDDAEKVKYMTLSRFREMRAT